MIPKGAQGIGHLITRVAQDLIPKGRDAYMATDLGYLTMLMGMIAQDYERAADVLVTEDAEISAILKKAVTVLEDKALAARIRGALDQKPANLKVAELTARSDLMLKLLIDLHAAVEEAEAKGAGWARTLDADIWRFLEAHVSRHAYEVAF